MSELCYSDVSFFTYAIIFIYQNQVLSSQNLILIRELIHPCGTVELELLCLSYPTAETESQATERLQVF